MVGAPTRAPPPGDADRLIHAHTTLHGDATHEIGAATPRTDWPTYGDAPRTPTVTSRVAVGVGPTHVLGRLTTPRPMAHGVSGDKRPPPPRPQTGARPTSRPGPHQSLPHVTSVRFTASRWDTHLMHGCVNDEHRHQHSHKTILARVTSPIWAIPVVRPLVYPVLDTRRARS